MNSLILCTAARFLLVIMLLFSFWVLLRGHDSPGGGFIGGLIAASAFSLYLIAYGKQKLARWFIIDLPLMLGIGLLLLLFSGLIAIFQDKPFLSGLWLTKTPFTLGSPLLFDLGIYLLVVISILTIIYTIEEYSV